MVAEQRPVTRCSIRSDIRPLDASKSAPAGTSTDASGRGCARDRALQPPVPWSVGLAFTVTNDTFRTPPPPTFPRYCYEFRLPVPTAVFAQLERQLDGLRSYPDTLAMNLSIGGNNEDTVATTEEAPYLPFRCGA